MVQIIERQEDAGGAERIDFNVYRSPINRDRILASWQHTKDEGHAVAIAGEMLGTPAAVEIRRAIVYANNEGVPFIWINDPHGVFPESERTMYRIALVESRESDLSTSNDMFCGTLADATAHAKMWIKYIQSATPTKWHSEVAGFIIYRADNGREMCREYLTIGE